jgi:TPR repeat protein
MARLADLPELVGFFSYSRDDDEAFSGTLSVLRDAIQRELGAQLGRSKKTLRLFQDKEAIAPGKLWEAEIKAAVEQAVFFIPIVTPRAVNSEYCRFEFEAFLARESALGRTDLTFPILYIWVPELESEAQWRNHPVVSVIAKRQYVDWQSFRYSEVPTPAMREHIGHFCRKIVETLRQSWLSPEERRQQEEIAAKQLAEEESRQRGAEAKRHAETETRRRAEEERRSREMEAKRLAEQERDKAVGDVTALGAKQDDRQEATRAGRKAAGGHERRERPSTKSSPQAQQSTMPELTERLEHVPSEQSKAAPTSVPWRIIAGSVGVISVLGVLAVVAVPRSPVAPPAPAVTSQPALLVTPQDASGMLNLGRRYANGDGVARDYAKAREWFEKAAAKDNSEAMNSLGWLYQNGLGVAQDYGKAREWFEKAAAKDNPVAMNNLGWLYQNGLGVAQDYGKAREWYGKAAAKGNADAMNNLGLLYHNGWGVASAEAREWFEKAAAKGNADAMNSLGLLYHNGWGVAQDSAKAREWFEKAAAKGNADAKAQLGR